jgi:hypothetical protein
MAKKIITIAIMVAIIIGGVAFYGGMKYAESKSPRNQFLRADFQNLSPQERQQRLQEFGANTAKFSGGQQRGGAGFATGEIIAKDDKSITIKLKNGGSKLVFFSDSTEIMKSLLGTLNDLEVGKNIVVNGTANPDGSITAQMIQLRPNSQ